MKCMICESEATSLHFGTASCKACAAFFRRTVALDITYECIGQDNSCEVNCERRMSCKRCRYDKCIRFNMQRDLVQSKRGRPDNNKMDEEKEPESPKIPDYSNIPSTSSNGLSSLSDDDDFRRLTEHFTKMDSNLNKSRRMAFTDSRLLDIFSGICKMPFEKHQLRPFDFRSYAGYQKQEYVMMFNYANALPDFQNLSNSEQNFLFRIACGVDFVVSSAYYTTCIGIENNLAVNHDGTYVQMYPLPLMGDEPGAATMFPKVEEFEKYKNLIRPKVKCWQDFIPKFAEMKLTFEENALLKALTCWQVGQYQFEEKGREISRKQKSQLMRCILRLCQDTYGDEEGAVRAGAIAVFVSLINEEFLQLVNTLIIMSFFAIMDGDPLINEILSTRTIFS